MSGELWQAVCALEEIEVERGVAALVHAQAIAIFRTARDEIHALANQDPSQRGAVLARGIVGRRGGIDFVALPLHRHAFDLTTGVCLQDPSVQVAVYDTRVIDGIVEVGARRERTSVPRLLRRPRRSTTPRRPELSRWPPLPRRGQ